MFWPPTPHNLDWYKRQLGRIARAETTVRAIHQLEGLKILHFDGTGYWLYYKLLEAGTFEIIGAKDKCISIDSTQLAMLLGGVSLVSVKRRKRYQRAS